MVETPPIGNSGSAALVSGRATDIALVNQFLLIVLLPAWLAAEIPARLEAGA